MKDKRLLFRPRSSALALEPRVLFDGAAAVAVDDHLSASQPQEHQIEVAATRTAATVEAPAANPAPVAAPTTLLVVDSRVADYQSLLNDLPANTMVRVISVGESGLAAIDSAINSSSNLQSVQIISHGSSGSLTLGSDTIDSSTLSSHKTQIQSWAPHLTASADILFYGCDIAAGPNGTALLTQMATLTGADLAASTDATGAAAKGGNWVLEQQTGQIDSWLVVSDSALARYDALLAAPVNTVPAAQTVAEDNAITFGVGKIISVADADGTVQSVSVGVTHGTLSLATTTGLTLTGDGTSSISITAGTIAQINTALDGLIYSPTANYAGADTLTITTNDGSTTDTDTVAITITANATAPVLTLPATSRTVAEDVPTYLDFTGTAITLTDADANDLQTLTLSVAHGTLIIKTDVAGGVSSATANNSSSVTLSGTAAQLQTTLRDVQGIQYTSNLNYNSSAVLGAEALTFNLSDGQHTLPPGSVSLNITAVNDAPTFSGAVAATVLEGGSTSFSRAQLASSDNALDVDILTGQQVVNQLMAKIDSLPGSGTLLYKGGAVVVGSVVPVTDLGNLTFTHDGTDITVPTPISFNVTVSDGGGGSTAGSMSVTVQPKNVAPTVSGAPTLIEGQVKVVAPTITLGDGFDTLANSTIVIDNIDTGGQGTLFIDADNDNIVDAGEALSGSTTLNAAQRANLSTQLKFSQNSYEPNTPSATSPAYRITVTDAGGGTGVPSAAIQQTITLSIQPNNDDPTFVNSHATIGTPLATTEGAVTLIINAMLQIFDADLNPANTTPPTTPEYQLVYTVGTRPTKGEIQVYIGPGLGYAGDGWITLGNGGRFTQAQVSAGQVRYYQTVNVADGPTTLDNFTFTVRDSAYGYDVWTNPANPTNNREGGLRTTLTGAIATQQFYFEITLLAAVNTPRVNTYVGDPRPATSGFGGPNMTYTFVPTGGMLNHNTIAAGTWDEANVGSGGAGYVITSGMLSYTITRTDTKGTPADPADDVSVTVPTNETVYTLSAQPGNGILQTNVSGSWQTIPTNGQFTQADINANSIRFVHNGSEDHTSTFAYTVSDGTPNHYSNTFGLDITPTNDRPTASGGTVQVTEGVNSYVRLDSTALAMADVDLSLNPAKRTGEGAQDFLWFKIVAQPADGGTTPRGELQRWNGAAWIAITPGQWLPSTLLTMSADGNASGLRYAHDGSEPLAYVGSPNLTFQYQVRDDLPDPSNPLATSAAAVVDSSGSAQSNQSANATATIRIIPVNNAPMIADKPGDGDPTIASTIASGGALTGNNDILANVPEGGTATITSALLTSIDPDNTTVQRQYLLKSVPAQGVLLLSSNILGVGSTFTQDDIVNNRVTYRHNGTENGDPITDALGTYNDKFHFVVSDAISDDTGAGATNYNTFLITLTPTNDAPTLTGPAGIVEIDSTTAAYNLVSGFVVADPDLTNGLQTGETDFVQATVRLLNSAGTPITDYGTDFAGGGVNIGYTNQAGGLWAVTKTGIDDILQLQGTRAQVNAALAGLSVTFANDANAMYKVQVIVDDRMRDISGALVTAGSDANGGELNQATTAGGTPTAVPATVYDWATNTAVPANDGNLAATSVDIRASSVNQIPTFTGPGAQTVNEDVRTQIPANSFAIADPESAAFNTPVTVTLAIPGGHGTLDVAAVGAQTSFTPAGGQAITIAGDGTNSITLTGRAADIQALLNQRNFANNAADVNGGLFYSAPANGNHDYNGGSADDITLTVSLNDSGSRFGSDTTGSGSVAANPADIIIPITITPVNDAPTVAATNTPIAINGVTAVTGFVINDVDFTDNGGIVIPGETDFVQATVRLFPASGTTPLSAGQHAGVTFSSSSAPAESVVVGSEFKIDTTYNGSGSALVIRGTQANVNAYLSGLTVALSTANDNTIYRVQVIADDRLRVLATGVLSGTAANGGLNSDGGSGTASVPDDSSPVAPYAVIPGGLTLNVAAGTRTILGSNVNENPSFNGSLDLTPTFIENGTPVVLDNLVSISDPELSAYDSWGYAVLTLGRHLGNNAEDLFSATGNLGALTQGGNLVLGGTTIGTVTTNSGGQLVLTFNDGTTTVQVNSVLQQIAYANSNNKPPASVTIDYTINDGDTDPDRPAYGQGAGGALIGTGSITVGVTAVNDAPVITPAGAAAAWTENTAAVTVDNTLTLTDLDDTQIVGGTVTISGNYLAGDVLAVTGNGPISGVYNGTGTLTLTGTDTLANYQTVLRSLTYVNSTDDPTSNTSKPTRTLTYSLTDANSDLVGAATGTATKTINITATTDLPVMSAGGTLAYTENQAAQVIDASVAVVSDADDTQMSGATVTLSAGYTAGDTLTFVTQNGISIASNAGGVLTLTGNATLAQYTTALQSVQFSSSSDDPTAISASRTVTWRVTDANSDAAGAGQSVAVTSTINITALPDAPTFSGAPATPTYTENGALTTVDAGFTVSDLDDTSFASANVTITGNLTSGDTLAVNVGATGIVANYTGGTGVLTLTGGTLANLNTVLQSLTFSSSSDDPTVNTTRTSRVLTYSVTDANSDGTGAQTSTATRNVTVVPATDNPVMSAGGTLAYTENQAAQVIDASVAVVSDADDTQMASATAQITTGRTTGDVLAVSGTAIGGTIGSTNITVTSYNAGTGLLTLTGTDTLANYQAALRAVTYVSTSDDPTATSTTRTITWRTIDANSDAAGAGQSVAVTSTINITALPDAPTFSGAPATPSYTENGALTTVDAGFTVADLDDTSFASASVSITGGNFTSGDTLAVNVGATGIVANYNGSTGVLTLAGGTLANLNTVLQSLTFSSSSDDPTLNTTRTSRVLTYSVTDANSDGTVAQTITTTRNVTVAPATDNPVMSAGGTLAYTQNQAAQVIDASVAVVSDADDIQMASATVQISAGLTTGDVLAVSGTAIGGTIGSTNIVVTSYNAGTGLLTLTGADTLAHYTAALKTVTFNSTSDDPTVNTTSTTRTITWRTIDANSDAAGAGQSVAVTSTINITALPDAPTFSGAPATPTYTENGALTTVDAGFTVSDLDDTSFASASVSITGNLTSGDTLAVNVGATGIVANYNGGTGVLTLTGGTLANLNTVLQSLTFSSSSDDPTVNTTRTSRVLTYSVTDANSDGTGAQTSTTTRNVTVVPATDNPVMAGAGNVRVFVENASPLTLEPLVAISDGDDTQLASATIQITAGLTSGDGLAVAGTAVGNLIAGTNITVASYNVSTGLLTLTGTDTLGNYQAALRAVTYVSTSDDPTATSASRTVTWRTIDANSDAAGVGTSNTVTTTINITEVNDAPVAVDDRGHSPDGRPVTVRVLDNDSDVDGDTLTISTIAGISVVPGSTVTIPSGRVTLNADGSLTYTPNPGVQGQVVFPYEISDGNGGTATANVIITVVPAPGVNSAAPEALTLPYHPMFGDQAGEPSVYFDGSVYNGVIRLPIPFHPAAFVNQAVEVAQQERMDTDCLSYSNPNAVHINDIQSRSIGASLGFDPALFVQPAVRYSQAQGELMDNLVKGRLTRISLSSDRLIATPDLSQPNPREIMPPMRIAEIAIGNEHESVAEARMESDIPTPLSTASPVRVTPRSAPSFTEQLRAAGGSVPIAHRDARRHHSNL